jgi:hypothetical protein
VSASTISGHLARLRKAKLLTVEHDAGTGTTAWPAVTLTEAGQAGLQETFGLPRDWAERS